MTEESIREFLQAVGTADWNIGLYEFSGRLDHKPDVRDAWLMEAWGKWKSFATACKNFDSETLAKIIAPKEVKPS